MIEEIGKKALLFDFYGPLLTNRQQEVFQCAYSDDMGLAEIGDELGISRQAVYDMLKRTEKILFSYEEKLGLVAKFLAISSTLNEIKTALLSEQDVDKTALLDKIKTIDDWERR